MELSMEPTTIPNWSMYMVDVKNRFGVEQLRNMGCGYAPRSQYWPLKTPTIEFTAVFIALRRQKIDKY